MVLISCTKENSSNCTHKSNKMAPLLCIIWPLSLYLFVVNCTSTMDSVAVHSLPAKRRKIDQSNNITFFINVDRKNLWSVMNDKARTASDVTIGWTFNEEDLENDHLRNYCNVIDVAIKGGMLVIDHLLSPQLQGKDFDHLLRGNGFGAFLRATSCFYQEHNQSLVDGAFDDLSLMYRVKTCRPGSGIDLYGLVGYMKITTILKRHLLIPGEHVCFDLMHQQMAEKDKSGGAVSRWILLGFWKAFMNKALLQQFAGMNQLERERLKYLYVGQHGMINILEEIWDQYQEMDKSDSLKITLPFKIQFEKMFAAHANLEQTLVERNIQQIVASWVSEGNHGRIGVVVERQPSDRLIRALKESGIENFRTYLQL